MPCKISKFERDYLGSFKYNFWDGCTVKSSEMIIFKAKMIKMYSCWECAVIYVSFAVFRWQGRLSGESICLPPTRPGFYFRTRCHMWIEK